MFKVKRIYNKVQESDGFRVLVDRLWPRGLSRKNAEIDYWFKEIAPSDKLRKWFGHNPKKWDGFQEKYAEELKEKEHERFELEDIAGKYATVTLLYGAKDIEHNNAVALYRLLAKKKYKSRSLVGNKFT